MTLLDLQTDFWREVPDTEAPHLFAPETVARMASDAQYEAVTRGMWIIDSDTPEICQIDYLPGAPILALDPRIYQIRTIIIDGQPVELRRASSKEMGSYYPTWRTDARQAMPTIYIEDWATGKIRLYPSPKDAGRVLLSVDREPLKPLKLETDTPELPPRLHIKLLHWMWHLALKRADLEIYDPKRSDAEEGLFVKVFGLGKLAPIERWAQERQQPSAPTLC